MMNQVIEGDCLETMRGFPSEYVDLIYLDPPFNTGKRFEDFDDQWKSKQLGFSLEDNPKINQFLAFIDDTAMANYLWFLTTRLLECKRVLRESGSIYLHCDSISSHYIKLLMDTIFGRNNYRNEIIWKRLFGANFSHKQARKFRNSTDTILFYAKDKSQNTFAKQYRPMTQAEAERIFSRVDKDGKRYHLNSVTGSRHKHGHSQYSYKGYLPEYDWHFKKETVEKLDKEGRLVWSRNGTPNKITYMHESKGKVISSIWEDIPHMIGRNSERVGYDTQKPLALLERIIKASSEEDDLILDPFCGSGTSLVAAKNLGRMYIGIDINPKAIEISRTRLCHSL